jgi:hypothetical protein
MKRDFLKRNIELRGRILRATGALILLNGGLLALQWNQWVAIALFAGALFMAFEAWRGWCAARACGIKTRW